MGERNLSLVYPQFIPQLPLREAHPGRTPPNVTRRLEMKYSRPVTSDLEYIAVQGSLVGRKGSQLTFSAEVRDPQGTLLARARAIHWIVEDLLQPRD